MPDTDRTPAPSPAPAPEPSSTPPPARHDAQDVRGGEIVLKRRRSRVVFIAGLAGFVLAMLIAALWR